MIKVVKAATYQYPPLEGVGNLGQVKPADSPAVFTQVLSRVIALMTLGGLLYFLFQLIIAGYDWIAAGGDAQKIKRAQDKLWQSFLGVGFVLVAVAFLSLLGYLMGGVDFLDLENIIKGFWGGP